MKKCFILLVLTMTIQASAQDIHFTQYASSPITLNPANTGLINTDWRAAANYRDQWSAINNAPFFTTTFSYDMSLLKGKLNGSSLGVGFLALYDQAGTAKLGNRTYGISLAYHQKLNKNTDKPSLLSIGAQGYLVQRSINADQLTFANPGQENINVMDPYPDFNLGVMYTGYIKERTSIYSGVSYYHLTRPIESFLGSDFRLNTRLAVHAGVHHELSERYQLYVSAAYQKQGLAYQIMLGGAAGITLNPEEDQAKKRKELILGAWARYQDAVAPYVGFEWMNARLGFSYDANISSLSAATGGYGAFEVSLIYNGGFGRYKGVESQYALPRF